MNIDVGIHTLVKDVRVTKERFANLKVHNEISAKRMRYLQLISANTG